MDTIGTLDIDELIVITGHLGPVVQAHIEASYDIPARFVEQDVQDGTAGAVKRAEPWVDQPVLIVFVDTLFDADLSIIERTDADGILWAKEVEDYQRFGVIVTDAKGNMTRIVEKPSEPVSKLANIGLYFIRDWQALFEGIDRTLAAPQQDGEWFLTEAFQDMIDRGRTLRTATVDGWYDCGKVETLLATNRHLLRQGAARVPASPFPGSKIVPPVQIADDVVIENSTIGPNVTLESGCVVRGSIIESTIVGRETVFDRAIVKRCLIGDGQQILERTLDQMVVDGGEAAAAR